MEAEGGGFIARGSGRPGQAAGGMGGMRASTVGSGQGEGGTGAVSGGGVQGGGARAMGVSGWLGHEPVGRGGRGMGMPARCSTGCRPAGHRQMRAGGGAWSKELELGSI